MVGYVAFVVALTKGSKKPQEKSRQMILLWFILLKTIILPVTLAYPSSLTHSYLKHYS